MAGLHRRHRQSALLSATVPHHPPPPPARPCSLPYSPPATAARTSSRVWSHWHHRSTFSIPSLAPLACDSDSDSDSDCGSDCGSDSTPAGYVRHTGHRPAPTRLRQLLSLLQRSQLSCSSALPAGKVGAATDTGPTRDRHGTDTGPTRDRHGADTGPTRDRHGTDTGPTRCPSRAPTAAWSRRVPSRRADSAESALSARRGHRITTPRRAAPGRPTD